MQSLTSVKHWASQPRRHKWVCIFRQGDKRQVRYFIDEKSAKLFAAGKEIEL